MDSKLEDTRRIDKLEFQLDQLTIEWEAAKKENVDLKKKFKETNDKIVKAESWGRAIIWTTIAIGGFTNQFGQVVAWLKK